MTASEGLRDDSEWSEGVITKFCVKVEQELANLTYSKQDLMVQ